MFKMFKNKRKLTDFKIQLLEGDGSVSTVDTMVEVKQATKDRDIYSIFIPLPSGEIVSISMNNHGQYQLKD